MNFRGTQFNPYMFYEKEPSKRENSKRAGVLGVGV